MFLHHKFSPLYHLLLDFDESSTRAAASEGFVAASGMPKNYHIFMKGLWYLDQQDFSRALEYVNHPSLIPDFADEIITVLVCHAPGNAYSLALSNYHTVHPILKTSSALELLFEAMARNNATETLLFSRTYSDCTREMLFQKLNAAALDNVDASGSANDLAFLPLGDQEKTWFEEFLTNEDGKSLKKAKETVLFREIASDRFAEVGKLKSSGQWGAILEGIKTGTEGHIE